MSGNKKASRALMDSSKTVFCKYCLQNLPNVKDTDTDVFLSHHQKWCSLSPHRSRMARSATFSQYNDSFNADVITEEEQPTMNADDEIQDNEYDDDVDVELRGIITAEECRLLDSEHASTATEHVIGSEIIYSPIQILKYISELRGFDINVLHPSGVIQGIQSRLLRILMTEEAHTDILSFRNTEKKIVEWKDLIQLFEFGQSVGLSDASGDRLLEAINCILHRHNSDILLRKSWRHIRQAIDKQKTLRCSEIVNVRIPLPSEIFGEMHYVTKRALRPFTGTVENIRGVIAEMLLKIPQSKLVLEYKPTMNGEDIAASDEQLLGEFVTGKLFEQFSEDAKKFGEVNGIRVIPLCFGVWADETTTSASRNMSELPVYISLLNAGMEMQSGVITYLLRLHILNLVYCELNTSVDP